MVLSSRTPARTLVVIAARGGSKGIPRKNLIDLCGKPLIYWSISQSLQSEVVTEVAVSSDSAEILEFAVSCGATAVLRPPELSGDTATSESAWIHALDTRESETGPFDRVVALQATSPIREPSDIDNAVETYARDALDSLLSVCEVEDFFNWRKSANGLAESINYDWRDRRRRQEIDSTYLENGSLYVVSPELLRATRNRLGGRIGMYLMAKHKMFQIDAPEDLPLCTAIMRGYGYA